MWERTNHKRMLWNLPTCWFQASSKVHRIRFPAALGLALSVRFYGLAHAKKLIRRPLKRSILVLTLFSLSACCLGLIGCSPKEYRLRADKEVEEIIEQKQLKTKGHIEPFTIETPADTLRRRLLIEQELPISGEASLGSELLPKIEDWPEENQPARSTQATEFPPWEIGQPLKLTLTDALMVAAANNREYQTRKEDIFRVALGLDLERDAFRNTYFGALESELLSDQIGDEEITGVANRASAEWSRLLELNGPEQPHFIDLVKLLTQGASSSFGIFADATISIPLMAGSGRNIVTEPLIQAERDVVYAMYTFERFKRSLAVDIASGYLSVLRQQDVLYNAKENYERLLSGAQRAERLTDAGRLSRVELDQARQDVLRARNSWISAQQAYANQLDAFKVSMGLPPDALLELDRLELDNLERAATAALQDSSAAAEMAGENGSGQISASFDDSSFIAEGTGLLALEPVEAVSLALTHRLDLRTAQDRVNDAQRKVVVTADALRAGLTLTGTAAYGERRGIGSADLDDADFDLTRGIYSAGLLLDLPWERTREQNIYRESYIALERSVRDVQELEDQIKLQVRNRLRTLLQTRESYQIQSRAVELARQRVDSAALFLEAGRAQVRDVLDAQDDYVSAQNDRIAALVDYRIAELELQRDMGVLEVDYKGLWSEYRP